MKLLFISDIHGIKTHLTKVKEKFFSLGCDKLVVLGDLYTLNTLYNDYEDYDPEYVESFLASFKDKLICIAGNCDRIIDKDTAPFPIVSDLTKIITINEDLYVTHGHIHNSRTWDKTNSTLIYGHFHIPYIKEIETNTYICVGSISLPRSANEPTYLYYNEKELIIYDIKDQIIAKKELNN